MLAHRQVEGADFAQFYPITISGLETTLVGAEYTQLPRGAGLVWLVPPRTSTSLHTQNSSETGPLLAWVSESFTARFDKSQGDSIEIPTPHGSQRLVIDGVFADYGNERGSIMVHHQHTAHWFSDSQLSNLAVYLRPQADAESVRREWAQAFPELAIQTNAKLREQALHIFPNLLGHARFAGHWCGRRHCRLGPGARQPTHRTAPRTHHTEEERARCIAC